MNDYRNPWHKGGKGYGPAYYEAERKVTSHYGFDIYYRAGCFDVVQNDICHMQMAGLSAAKRWCEENKFKQVA